MKPLLELENVRVRFRTHSATQAWLAGIRDPFVDAVCGVSLEIAEGQTYGLVGESGSGKTTLARSIIGLVKPSEGSIRFENRELTGLSASDANRFRRHVGTMFEAPVGSLTPRMTIRTLLAEPFRIHGLADVDIDHEVRRLLDLVGLGPHFSSRYPHQLSGGQARRVGVARAIALNPRLIVADEPTAGLDVSVQGEILNLLGRLQGELGVSILVITHNLNVVRHITDRMGIMYLGRLLEQGPTREIFRQPRHPYTLALLSANPEPDPDAQINRVELQGEVPSLINRPSGCEFHPRCPFSRKQCGEDFPATRAEGNHHLYNCHYPR